MDHGSRKHAQEPIGSLIVLIGLQDIETKNRAIYILHNIGVVIAITFSSLDRGRQGQANPRLLHCSSPAYSH